MTDLELTRLAAEAMGIQYVEHPERKVLLYGNWEPVNDNKRRYELVYEPLVCDSQAMEIIKKLRIKLHPNPMEITAPIWLASINCHVSVDIDLNRCVVACAALMQQAKSGG